MKVTKKTVERTAGLAMLNLTREEKESLKNDFNKIISYIDVLNDLDIKGSVPESHKTTKSNVFRNDEASVSSDAADMFGNASSKEAGGIKVPKILE
ncbi:MAG: Asp-tRNA(Asn)/Glu-tRNA(Gln) amidotransferase subunit GatC [Eubacteriales bacterium]|nr:Asp-tRNA(Asn)/Glu-tRNA(Gln) amidotransferase subunit GatC [Eubacteriales bacterium]